MVGHVSEVCTLEPLVTHITCEVVALFTFWNSVLSFSTFEFIMLIAYFIPSSDLVEDRAVDSLSILHEEEF